MMLLVLPRSRRYGTAAVFCCCIAAVVAVGRDK